MAKSRYHITKGPRFDSQWQNSWTNLSLHPENYVAGSEGQYTLFERKYKLFRHIEIYWVELTSLSKDSAAKFKVYPMRFNSPTNNFSIGTELPS